MLGISRPPSPLFLSSISIEVSLDTFAKRPREKNRSRGRSRIIERVDRAKVIDRGLVIVLDDDRRIIRFDGESIVREN